MLLFLITWLSLHGRLSYDQPPERPDKLTGRSIERMRNDQLTISKVYRAFLEETIKTFETDLRDPSLYSPSLANRIRQELPYLRKRLQFVENVQREFEWWQQQRKANPGSDTDLKAIDRLEKVYEEWEAWKDAWDRGVIAPMPREKK